MPGASGLFNGGLAGCWWGMGNIPNQNAQLKRASPDPAHKFGFGASRGSGAECWLLLASPWNESWTHLIVGPFMIGVQQTPTR